MNSFERREFSLPQSSHIESLMETIIRMQGKTNEKWINLHTRVCQIEHLLTSSLIQAHPAIQNGSLQQ